MKLPAQYRSRLQMEEVVDSNCVPLKNRDGKQLYRVLSPLSFWSAALCTLITVPAEFVTDLDSTPRYPIIYWLMNGFGDMPAVTHDYLYSTGALTRKESDDVLYEACLATHVPRWKAYAAWAAVRIRGAGHFAAQYLK